MWRMLLMAAGVVFLAGEIVAADPKQRTDSGQFTIYCDDAALRREVASFAARTKESVLALIDEADSWKRPIVITIELNPPLPPQQEVSLDVVETVVGMKIEIVARVGNERADINLQKQVTKAVLLEFMHRREGIKAGTAYVEPPWWMVEGAVEIMRRKEDGADARLFRTLVETNKLPPIESFLAEKPAELGPTALAMDRALAMAFVQALLEQPDGRRRLSSFLLKWPKDDGDPVAALGREFPTLGAGAPALQKWWTLNLARLAANDRVRGLSTAETDQQLGALLTFEIPGKDGVARRFGIGDFAEYAKLPAARRVLAVQHASIVTLSARANVLFKPALEEYAETFALLAKGKTRGIAERLERAGELRKRINQRAEDIADYLNWYEATQFQTRSGAFDSYLKMADEIERESKVRRGPIARYLDEMEREFAPTGADSGATGAEGLASPR